jgi:hypothetical protein
MKYARSPEGNGPDLFDYRKMTTKETRFSTAC